MVVSVRGALKVSYEIQEAKATVGWNMPTFVPRRYHPGGMGTWSGHLAFAHDLIMIIRPKLIVELGTHWGESYFTFCQTVAQDGLDSICYAIDNWRGEEHSGYYGEEVFADVVRYNEQFYRSFSYLLRTDFDESLSKFENQSIDLLHIDGLHTYDAGSHDFRSWIPKVRPGGIVLLHDICARHVDFGIWQLWDELKAEFSETFEFHHSWGLGVLRNGEGPGSPELKTFFSSAPSVEQQIRKIYSIYASHLDNLLLRVEPEAVPESLIVAQAPSAAVAEPVAQAVDEPARTTVQVYISGPDAYSEDKSLSQVIEIGTKTHIAFVFPDGIGSGPLRIDPATCGSMVEFMSMALHSAEDRILWEAQGAELCGNLLCSGTSALFPQQNRCLVLSYGADPQVILPKLTETGAVRLEITMRVDELDLQSSGITAVLLGAQALADAECSALRAEAMLSSSERVLLEAEVSRVATERNQAWTDMTSARASLNGMADEVNRMADEVRKAEVSRKEAEERLEGATEKYRKEHATLESVLQSKSWRLTEPLRRIMLKMRLK
jgi:hypothetical protein